MNNVLELEKPIAPISSILLAGDNTHVCRLYIKILVDSGYCVDTAKDGEVAWDALQIKSYQFLITDNDMPKMSGIELAKKARAAKMTLPIIIVSGKMQEEDLKEHSYLQISTVLPKPHRIADFLKTVKHALGLESARRIH